MHIKTTLLDPTAKPVSKTAVEVVGVSAAGDQSPLGSGVTDQAGVASFDVALPDRKQLLALRLLAQIGAKVVVGESPDFVANDQCDFGTLIVSAKPFYTLAQRSVYGMPEAAWKAKLVEEQNNPPAPAPPAPAPPAPAPPTPAPPAPPGSYQQEKDALQAEIALLKSKLVAAEATRAVATPLTPVTMSDLVTGAGEQLSYAQAQIKESGGSFLLGSVKMSLKGVPTEDGTGVRFLGPENMAATEAAHVSSIELEFISGNVERAPPPPSGGVPDVMGYTEIMALRKLAAVGLHGTVGSQMVTPVPGSISPVGRVVKQVPAPGEPPPVGAPIQLFLGKKS